MCFQKKIKLEQWRSGSGRRRWWRLVVPGTKRPKKRRTCIITHLWSNVHDHLVEVLIIHRELSVLLFQGHELLRTGVRYWLGAPDGWDTTGRLQVLDRSVGEPVHLIFFGSTKRSYLHPQIRIEIWMGWRIVLISLPQPTIIGLLKIKIKRRRNHHIQFKKNNNLRNKMVERTYHDVGRIKNSCPLSINK